MKKLLVTLLAAAAVLMGSEQAETPNPLVTHTELGYVKTGGNSDTESFSMDFKAKKTWALHSLGLGVDALYGTENGVENNNKVYSELNYDWQFEKRLALNYIVGYKDDKFSGFDYQFFTGPGAKYIFLDSQKLKLTLQGNVLYNSQQEMDKYYDDNGTVEVPYPYPDGKAGLTKVDGVYSDFWGYLLKGDFRWTVVEGFALIEEASYRSDFDKADNYFVHAKTAVESKINGNFSLGVSYKVDYTNIPPAGNERTDTTFTVALIVDY